MIETIFFEIDEDFWCETRFLKNVISILEKYIDNYSIVVTPNLKQLPLTKYRKIVILTGDELGNFGMNPYPNYDVLCVFRIYNHLNRYDDKLIYPIPTGYNWTMHSDRSKKMVEMYPNLKLSDREIDIFYTGQMCIPARYEMITSLDKIKNKFKVLSNITGSFRTGMDIDEYYKILGRTKIALCPDGTSVDTFRYVESFGSGCIVITTNKENIWYYRDSPAFFINSWSELNENLIYTILSKDIDKIYNENLNYYSEKLSEAAVSNYMLQKINITNENKNL